MPRRWLFLAGLLCLALAAGNAQAGAPSTGTIEVAIIMADFQDRAFDDDRNVSYFEEISFGENDSFRDYYDEVSQGALDIQGDVFGPYTLDGNASDYGAENPNFVTDSIEAADGDIDYRDYDAVMVLHAGPGQESTGVDEDIWSVHWRGLNILTNDGGHRIRETTQVPEYQDVGDQRSPVGVWCHEFGHELGLPDFYDTDGSSEGIGHWGIMSAGNWLDNGETPGHFMAYSKVWLGWIEPVVVEADLEGVVLEPVEGDGVIYKLPIPGNWTDAPEYFLLENRQQIGYDSYLPGTGLMIWHVNETTLNDRWSSNTVNDDEEHKGVDLEAADGDDDMDDSINRGDSGDPWTSGSFTASGYPDSTAYNGTDSGWRIQNIAVDALNILLDITFLSEPHAVADADEAVVLVNESLQFYGHDSWDDDGEIVNFTWDFDDGTFAYIDDPVHLFDAFGTYEVTLTVKDDNDLTTTVTLTIYVNAPPVAVAEAAPLVVALGEAVFFNGSGSYDPDGVIAFYYWNFDDGRTSNQAEVSHIFADSGTFNVSFKVSDNRNTITTIYLEITVLNEPPQANFTITPAGGNTTVNFAFSDTSTDSDGTIAEWAWDFGDGNASNAAEPMHHYALPGSYTVTLRVVDDQGANDTISHTVNVTNALPVVVVTVPESIPSGGGWIVAVGENYAVDGRGCYDPEGLPLAWNWSLDGVSYGDSVFTATLPEADHTLELNLSDAHGGWVRRTWQLQAVVRPVVSLTPSAWHLLMNETLVVTAAATQGSVASFAWDLAGSPGNASAEQRFTPSAAGAYEIAAIGYTAGGLPSAPVMITVHVYDLPVANVTIPEAVVSQGYPMHFNASASQGLNLSYHWWLDAQPLGAADTVVEHTFDLGGWHSLTLTVVQAPVGEAQITLDFYVNWLPTIGWSVVPVDPEATVPFVVNLTPSDPDGNATITEVVFLEGVAEAVAEGYRLTVDAPGVLTFTATVVDDWGAQVVLSFNVTVRPYGLPDGVVTDLRWEGGSQVGKVGAFDAVITNIGPRSLEAAVRISLDGEMLREWQINLAPGEVTNLSYAWRTIVGRHTVQVDIVPVGGEADAGNNHMTVTVVIQSDESSSSVPTLGFAAGAVLLILAARRRRGQR